jgi:hypothetical protein
MKLKIALAAAAGLLLVAPTVQSATAKSPADGARHNGRQCFYTRNADGFAAPDDKTLNVRVGPRDVYQFKMFGHCTDIDWANHIALVSRGSDWICQGLDAEVITRSPIGPQRCMVRDMHKLTPAEIAVLPKGGRP